MTTATVTMDRGYYEHGLAGVTLCIVGDTEYALGVVDCADKRLRGEVFRRWVSAASDPASQYGGWRWECSPHHALERETLYPEVAASLRAIGYSR